MISNIVDLALALRIAMCLFALALPGLHLPILRLLKPKLNFKICLLKQHASRYSVNKKMTFMQVYATGLCWVSKNHEIIWQTRVFISNLSRYQSEKWPARGSLSFQVTVSHESVNRFVIYESKARSSLRPGEWVSKFRKWISSYLLPGEKTLKATKKRKYQ